MIQRPGNCDPLPPHPYTPACHGQDLSWAGLVMGRTCHGQDLPWAGLAMGRTCHGQDLPWAGLVMGRTCHGQDLSWAGLVLGRTCPGQDLSWAGLVLDGSCDERDLCVGYFLAPWLWRRLFSTVLLAPCSFGAVLFWCCAVLALGCFGASLCRQVCVMKVGHRKVG